MNPQLPAPATSAPAGPVLRDIHLPPSPSWWPPAPGWWVLAGLLVVALLLLLRGLARRRRRMRERAALLAMVDDVLARTEGDFPATTSALHALLRRAARRLDARVDTQQGDAWRNTLARVPVGAGVIDCLVELEGQVYRPSPVMTREAAADAVRQWLAALSDLPRRQRQRTAIERGASA